MPKNQAAVRFLITLFTFLIYGFHVIGQDELLSGLYFSSHEVIQDKRTSLNLTPEDPFRFPDGFSLEMEANFRHGDGHYGYIFRIIGNGHTNIDLVSNLASTSSNFWLVLKDKMLISYQWNDIPNGGFDRWTKIRLDVDIRNTKLAVSFNGERMETLVPDLAGLKDFSMVFGACRNSSFFNTDVSPMSLKDIQLFDQKQRLVRSWKLSKHNQTVVYDEINHAQAQVENPNWIIDKHVKWRKLKHLTFDSILGIAPDEQTGRIFFIDKKAVYIFSAQTPFMDTLRYSSGIPYSARGNQIIYNRFTNELWSYDFFKGLKGRISKFNFSTRAWSNNQAAAMEPDFWHHNKFISPADSSLVTLFGYGHYTYKGILNKYTEATKTWIQTDISQQVQPRYLSAFGMLNQKEALVFGGYGSITGRQELSPEFYYDLYKLNLKDFTFSKQWTLSTPLSPFVPCESLIADKQNGQFYTLLYNRGKYSTYLHLALFKTDSPEYHLYKDSIPYDFLDTNSWSTLMLDQKTSQLIAVTAHDLAVELYSIAYPPLMPDKVNQSITVKNHWYAWVIGAIAVLGSALAGYFLIRKKKGRPKKEGWYEPVEHPNITPILPLERPAVSSILFMGGFQVYNHQGRNLTSAFSPTVKQLFLFIFLHSIKNGKGVSSAKLDEVLWYDKLGESARNNRNVNISKLRTILDELDVEVINENSFWKIRMKEAVYCDYCEILNLVRKSKSVEPVEDGINRLIGLLSFGEFLPNEHNEWMDDFKSAFANEIIDGLSSLFNENEVKANFSLRYHLAECILVYDPFNDEAFTIKCSILYHLGKKGMAKNLHDTFCREYKKALDMDYPVSFSDTIK
jgi:DNA-binding SARP family transcriptional activator